MKKITLGLFLFILFLVNAFATGSLEIMINGRKIYWQDPAKKNRYYLDLNGDRHRDGMDVILKNGMDAYSELGSNGKYGKKLRVRFEAGAVVEEYQKRQNLKWHTYKTRLISKISENEADYKVWHGPRSGEPSFMERLDSSSLQSAEIMCHRPSQSQSINFAGIEKVLSQFYSMFDFDQSCYDLCDKIVDRFNVPIKKDKFNCKYLFESLADKTLENTFSCLAENPLLAKVGTQVAHRILSGLRPVKSSANSGHIKVKCVENKKYLAKVFGILPSDEKSITLDIADFVGNNKKALTEQFSRAFGHEIYHLGNFYHTYHEVDVSYACNECCTTANKVACAVCAGADKPKMEKSDYLLTALLYLPYVGPDKKFRAYHKTLEKLHGAIQDDSFFIDFEKKIPLTKGEIIDQLYTHLTTHLRNPVDDRGEGKLRYSDMIAEIMAKLNCADVGRKADDGRTAAQRYSCEVMYLARSVPASYCYNRKSKESCVQAIRLRYLRRKKIDQTGIAIPDNFLSLDRSYD